MKLFSRNAVLRAIKIGSATAMASVVLFSNSYSAQSQTMKLTQPGNLTIAFTADMPGSGWQDGKLIGYDGEIMQKIADVLKLPVKPALMEWSGTIASVQAGRVDAMLGTMGWTEQRSKIMLLSEPIHYFKNGIAQANGNNWEKLADLQNRKVGTITGFSFIPELRKINGLQLSLYDTSDAAVRDLLAGRIDAVIGDPPVMQYAISQNPKWNIHFKAFTDNNPDFPLLTGLGQVVFGMNIDNPGLAAAVNQEIGKLWQGCRLKEIGAKYGLTQDVWYQPNGKNFRAGVDRPADYKLPSC